MSLIDPSLEINEKIELFDKSIEFMDFTRFNPPQRDISTESYFTISPSFSGGTYTNLSKGYIHLFCKIYKNQNKEPWVADNQDKKSFVNNALDLLQNCSLKINGVEVDHVNSAGLANYLYNCTFKSKDRHRQDSVANQIYSHLGEVTRNAGVLTGEWLETSKNQVKRTKIAGDEDNFLAAIPLSEIWGICKLNRVLTNVQLQFDFKKNNASEKRLFVRTNTTVNAGDDPTDPACLLNRCEMYLPNIKPEHEILNELAKNLYEKQLPIPLNFFHFNFRTYKNEASNGSKNINIATSNYKARMAIVGFKSSNINNDINVNSYLHNLIPSECWLDVNDGSVPYLRYQKQTIDAKDYHLRPYIDYIRASGKDQSINVEAFPYTDWVNKDALFVFDLTNVQHLWSEPNSAMNLTLNYDLTAGNPHDVEVLILEERNYELQPVDKTIDVRVH